MSNSKKISQFPLAASLEGQDLFAIVQNADNFKITTDTLKSALSSTFASNRGLVELQEAFYNISALVDYNYDDLLVKINNGDTAVRDDLTRLTGSYYDTLNTKIDDLTDKHNIDIAALQTNLTSLSNILASKADGSTVETLASKVIVNEGILTELATEVYSNKNKTCKTSWGNIVGNIFNQIDLYELVEEIIAIQDVPIDQRVNVYASVNNFSFGDISPRVRILQKGGNASFTATAAPGYVIQSWVAPINVTATGIGSNVGVATLTNALSDASIICNFVKKGTDDTKYTVTASANYTNRGSIIPAIQQVQSGNSATVTATANPGYYIDRWVGPTGMVSTGVKDFNGTATIPIVTENADIICGFELIPDFTIAQNSVHLTTNGTPSEIIEVTSLYGFTIDGGTETGSNNTVNVPWASDPNQFIAIGYNTPSTPTKYQIWVASVLNEGTSRTKTLTLREKVTNKIVTLTVTQDAYVYYTVTGTIVPAAAGQVTVLKSLKPGPVEDGKWPAGYPGFFISGINLTGTYGAWTENDGVYDVSSGTAVKLSDGVTYETFDEVNRNYVLEVRVSEKPTDLTYKLEVSPSSQEFENNGGEIVYSVTSTKKQGTTTTDVSYTAELVNVSNNWITLNYNSTTKKWSALVSQNTSTSPRSAEVRWRQLETGGETKITTISQKAASSETKYTFSVSPSSGTFASGGETKFFSITSTKLENGNTYSVGYSVQSKPSWCSVSNGVVHAEYYSGTSDREGDVVWRQGEGSPEPDISVHVYQYGVTPPQYILRPATTSYSILASGESRSTVVTSTKDGSSYNWSASSNQGWCSLTASSGGNGATLAFTVSANTTTSSRSATITISQSGGETATISVTQAGLEDYKFTVTTSKLDFAYGGGTGNIYITVSTRNGSAQGWTASVNGTGFGIDKTSGTGNATIVVTATVNATSSKRLGTVVLTQNGSGNRHDVTLEQQAGGTKTLTINYRTNGIIPGQTPGIAIDFSGSTPTSVDFSGEASASKNVSAPVGGTITVTKITMGKFATDYNYSGIDVGDSWVMNQDYSVNVTVGGI